MSARRDTSNSTAYVLLAPMGVTDLADVARVESIAYRSPWTLGNFSDSLVAGYSAWTLRDHSVPSTGADLIGYFVMMAALEEAHLLNITVDPAWQGRGFGLVLLNKAAEIARSHRVVTLLLEVRPSNHRAMAVYERYGFRQIGIRRNYYPVSDANAARREDALVMSVAL